MSSVVQQNGGNGGAGGRSWRLLWQAPLFGVGVGVFVYGVWFYSKHIKPIPFETQTADVETLLKDGRFADAVAQINKLAKFYTKPTEEAVLERLAGDTQYLAQLKSDGFVKENYEHAVAHYRDAASRGAKIDAVTNERWGEAALAAGDSKEAVEKMESAEKQDPSMVSAHAKKLVEAYRGAGQQEKAAAVLHRVLTTPGTSVDDRAWALCTQIDMALEAGATSATLQKLVGATRKSLGEIAERDPAGRVLLAIARAELQQSKIAEAKADLEEARRRFIVHHLDDGRATVLLGNIALQERQLDHAGELFQDVVTRDAGTSVWPAARLGRAEVSVLQGEAEVPAVGISEATLADYRFAMAALKSTETERPPELLTMDQIRSALSAHADQCLAADRLEETLLFLRLLGEIGDPEDATMALRLATTRERRSAELLATSQMPTSAKNVDPERSKERASGLRILGQSAEDYLRHSYLTTMEDAISANSLWHAAQLFDQAGETQKSINAYQQFVQGRPRDARTPEGWLAIGRLYQSVGKIQPAIDAYTKNIAENARTPAAYTSAVNLAQCYMAKGPSEFGKAEKSLLSLVQDNADLLPTAREFRVSLFTLGDLYYRNGKWADAILRLEEALDRYPDDADRGSALFMLAESYRKSANDVGEALKADATLKNRDSLQAARDQRLHRAWGLFSKVIDLIDGDRSAPTKSDVVLSSLDETYLATSYMDRAECAFALKDYATAIRLYDETATRFATKIVAAEAYVQIVNAYRALNETSQASAAAERAQWILKRIPDEAFGLSASGATRNYYTDFFKLGRLQ